MTDRSLLTKKVDSSSLLTIVGGILAGLILIFGFTFAIARLLAFEFGSAFHIVLGSAVVIATLRRPDWFWEDPRALALRGVVGDVPAIAFYLLFGLGAAGFGAVRQWEITSARRRCAEALALTQDSHQRFNILYYQGADHLPPLLVRAPASLTCEQLRP